MSSIKPWYSEEEIADLCEGLVQPAAQIRFLRGLGLHVTMKPNGHPLLMRAHAEAVLSGRQEQPQGDAAAPDASKPQPNRAALLQFIRGSRNGSQKKVQPA